MLQNALPALLLLALMVGLALALKWARGRLPGLPTHGGPPLRVLSSLALGPQHRVVTVQVGEGENATCLVLGVAPGAVQALHQMPVLATATPVASPAVPGGGFAARLAQLTRPPKDTDAPR